MHLQVLLMVMNVLLVTLCPVESTGGVVAQAAVAERAAIVSAVLPAEFSAVRKARELVHTALADSGNDSLTDDVALVASELVANALIHGLRLPARGCGSSPGRASSRSAGRSGRVELELVSTGSHLICSVRDPNPLPPVRRLADEASPGGRGLQLIESLSLKWGWTPVGGAKSVWAIFPLVTRSAVALRAS